MPVSDSSNATFVLMAAHSLSCTRLEPERALPTGRPSISGASAGTRAVYTSAPRRADR